MFAVSLAVVIDASGSVVDRLAGRPVRGLHLTRPVLAVVLYPFVLFDRFRGLFGEPPLRVATIGDLLALTPWEFEEAMAQALRDRGYRNVERCGGPGDLAETATSRLGAAVVR